MPAPRKKKAPPAPLGRYLRKFTLENVRTFRSPVTLDFCHADGSVAQWTVILGENGTGKTTLLQYLAGMMVVPDETRSQVVRADVKQVPLLRPLLVGRDWFGWNAANLPRPWTKPMELAASAELSVPATTLSGGRPEDELIEQLDLKLTYDENPDGTQRITVNFKIHQDIEFYTDLRFFAYGAGRHVAGAGSPYLSSESFFQNGGNSPITTIFQDDVPLISPEQWLLGLDHAARSEGEMKKNAARALQSARRCLRGALPGVLDLAIKPYGLAKGQAVMTLLCRTPFGEVPFSALSVGYRTMAAWLTDFIKRMHEEFPEMDEPGDGPAVVLIDEFDLHMHPKWQREAMAALSKEFPNTQFIVTAHSPLVVQATEGDARIIVLRRKERADGTEEVEVINEPHYAAGWRVDQILASDLYDLPPRSPRFAALMEERIRLRQKEKRNKADEKRIAEIEQTLDAEAPPESAPETDKLLAKLGRALDRAEAKQKK